MATGDKSFEPSRFVKQSKYWLDNTYRNWKEVFNSPLDQEVDTICIPDARDVLPNRRRDTEENAVAQYSSDSKRMDEQMTYKKNLVGQEGEDKFIRAFRQLKLGGIFISGFNTEEFIKEMKSKCGKWKEKYGHFECDAIFLHHQLGMFIIEIKSCESEKMIPKRFSEAEGQLQRIIPGMKEVFRRITGSNECPFRMQGVICFPNTDVSLSSGDYIVLGKLEMECSNFRNRWLPMVPQSYSSYSSRHTLVQGSLESISDDLHAFIACISGYRSAIFTSLMSNALEIYRMIDQQDFSRKKTRKQETTSDYVWHRGEAIILNSEQLRAVECSAQQVIISGPPGTGKTTVLLLRALEAAKLEKNGRVMVYPGILYSPLRELFQKIVDSNGSEPFIREIVVTVNRSQTWSLDDDHFFDEAYVDLSQYLSGRISVPEQPLHGLSGHGTYTMVVTGFHQPEQVVKITEGLRLFSGFHHIELKTVIRGTLSIINEWQHHFPDRYLTYGHNVQGAPVERITVNDEAQLFSAVEKIVRNLLNGTSSAQIEPDNNFLHTIEPKHIAIISLKNHEHIKNYLSAKGISCNSNYQTFDSNVVAINHPFFVLSCDWPVVICVKDSDDNSNHLIACSRCISKLYIIQGQFSGFS